MIKNHKQLAINSNRKLALAVAEAGLKAADAGAAVRSFFRHSELREESLKTRHLFIIGVGKGSLKMTKVLEEVLGNKITAGIVLDIHKKRLRKIKSYVGDHPFPSQRNINATQKIINLLSTAAKDDLVIACIAGGGSSLLCQPNKSICQQEIDIVRALSNKGIAIKELNIVRKHLSLARGGHLAHYAYPARVLSLIVSDIPDDDLRYIASGPTIRDVTTINDAKKILKKYGVKAEDFLIETPKDKKYFKQVRNVLILSNKQVLKAMANKAKELGLKPRVCDNCLQGEAKQVGLDIIKQLGKEKPGAALLYGGETIVTIKKGNGSRKGGRNMELALSALKKVKKGQILISFTSDGIDNTEFAGGVCDLVTKEKASKSKLNIAEFLKTHNSYNFFKKTNCAIITGYTGSNVSDLIVAINV
ncbi:MAG: DUF4147 domain-containing protein [Patescibacteria group bacterium]